MCLSKLVRLLCLNVCMILIVFILNISIYASERYQYECQKTNNHIIHIVTLNQKDYEIELIKAHSQVFGRETVEAIANRTNADIAVNSGFFEIGYDRDGMPSGTLIIDGKILGFSTKNLSCLIKHNGKLSIQQLKIEPSIKIGNKIFDIKKINQFPEQEDIVLYNNLWGKSTLTSFKARTEVVIDDNYTIKAVYKHGDIAIPNEGFVISFPKSLKVSPNLLDKITVDFNSPLLVASEKASIVMGIPQLVIDGAINAAIFKETSFYNAPHARTAIGLKSNGNMVIVLAEHAYIKNLNEVTLSDIQALLQNKQTTSKKPYTKVLNDITLGELKDIIKQEFTIKDKAVGLTLPELAQIMIDQNCYSAINLDGGGSSILFVSGKVINKTYGDKDEDMGRSVLRPVSDAIILRKKHISKTK